jgi:hypothetical protein
VSHGLLRKVGTIGRNQQVREHDSISSWERVGSEMSLAIWALAPFLGIVWERISCPILFPLEVPFDGSLT